MPKFREVSKTILYETRNLFSTEILLEVPDVDAVGLDAD